MDKLDALHRSENMRRIRSKNTEPEMLLRSVLHRKGYRFRIHRKDLPGKPDIIFASRRKAVFVHGCFWHQHSACREGRIPGSRQEYWKPKLARNIERDEIAVQSLLELGWKVLVVWECELMDELEKSAKRVQRFLGPTKERR